MGTKSEDRMGIEINQASALYAVSEERRMRLINADSLKKNLIKWMKQDDPTHPSEIPPLDDMIVSTIMTVDEEPTVEAIPVEYIRHWIHALNHVRRNGKVWAAIVLQALLDAWARAEREEE